MSTPATHWLRSEPAPNAHLRLICFPFAGGAASVFHSWQAQAPAGVQVCPVELPGRGGRYSEPPARNLPAIVETLALAIPRFLDCPYILFGHSLGGLLAFEFARELRKRQLRAPLHLFASASPAPQLPSVREPIHHLDNSQFLERLTRLNGIPHGLKEDPEILAVLLPALKADFELSETYKYTSEPPFDLPITAIGGNQDSLVSAADLVAWHTQTSGRFRLRLLPGGHFFLRSCPERVLQTVLEEAGPR